LGGTSPLTPAGEERCGMTAQNNALIAQGAMHLSRDALDLAPAIAPHAHCQYMRGHHRPARCVAASIRSAWNHMHRGAAVGLDRDAFATTNQRQHAQTYDNQKYAFHKNLLSPDRPASAVPRCVVCITGCRALLAISRGDRMAFCGMGTDANAEAAQRHRRGELAMQVNLRSTPAETAPWGHLKTSRGNLTSPACRLS
jgi:hypothetical protein